TLGSHSFRPLLARYVEWAKAFDAEPEDREVQLRYELLTESMPLLHATCRKEDTAAVVAAWKELGEKSSWRDGLERILEDKGDPAVFVSVLIQSLRRAPGNEGERGDAAALSAVAH